MSRFGFLTMIGALLLAAGCVPSNQYADMKYKYEEEAAKSRRLAEENAKLQAALRAKHVDVDALMRELSMLETAPEKGSGRTFAPIAGTEVTILEKGGIRLGGLNFRSGSAELTDSGKAALSQVAQQLKAKPGFILVVDGHTDSDPISKSNNASNWELSGKRAAAVTDYLVKAGVCDGQNAFLRGFGEFRPISNEKARYRRVEIYAFDAPGLSGGRTSSAPASTGMEPDAGVPAAPPTRPAPRADDPTLK